MQKKKLFKTLKLVAKIVLSAAILWYISTKIDVAAIGRAIARANVWWLVLALFIYSVSQVAASFRLNTLFRLIPIRISQVSNLRLYWLGLFYNLFLPGGVGGDGFKVYMLNHYLKVPVKRSLGAIFADRLSGLTIIVTYLLVLLHFVDLEVPYKNWLIVAIPVPVVVFFFFMRWVLPLFKKAFFAISLWSLLVQGIQMLAAVCILNGLGVDNSASYDDYLFLFFVSAIMASVPVTLGGIGAREFAFLIGAQYLTLQQDQAVALSLLFFLISALSAFPGILFTITPREIINHYEEDQKFKASS
ncbi:lysylphosphatidylglycerol synthase transmembrane domain-containing protein [Marinilabilia rubra]|uniref:Lysylphosphatidylglycerol synthetase family protein n=1 Tax=Marinilabilia rubra TaxID=2162893 RepID=A0A2U2BDJ4_9BACT|nr:lysylphosphatidylglycerol synthase transmembrane domain-containing protein [Marinilabilia rubra]PWE01144.1 lysylphosphatidylglycerol synthetase family protein [Marinilabilia rubra]